ncbi:hypothetical protein Pcar_0119 [Syntrophotalea carbinolica DSM 2380]|uniref:Competence protein CoiA-like N-terminal domain-containing protein n=1 Tax=Syntrophotalea carbinolica (strain DSM 2380 / NBRC 103641 / GraBd1) TaxID=338963 RepID=Q3A8B1_SYNC1|nr:competence protein CoiA family protein [Syntrophotalea carbinolica]ABA87381.2 hypothetical protein Pcar_0119 [Syntrophotalea carbinolica DSM 2380]
MSDVLLPIAKVVSDGSILHISDTPYMVLKDKDLVCPFCGGRVYKRAGTRQPHFYHKPKNDCNISRETLLHEGAKHFIHDRLVKNIEFKIYVDTSKIDSVASIELLTALGINSFSISSKSVFQNTNCQHEIEKNIDCFRPDILSVRKTKDKKQLFAWEVFVSHGLEEEKISHFIADDIGFVELIPQVASDPFEGYVFSLNRFNKIEKALNDELVFSKFQSIFENQLFEISKERIEDRIVQEIVEKRMIKIEKTLRNNIENEYIDKRLKEKTKSLKEKIIGEIANQKKEEAQKSICFDIRDLPVGFSLKLTNCLTQRFSTQKYHNHLNLRFIGKGEVAKKVQLIDKGKFKNIRINSQYNILSPYDCYANIVLFLISVGYCKPLLRESRSSSRKQLVGLRLYIPNALKGEIKTQDIIIGDHSEYEYPKEDIIDFELKKWKNKGKWILIAKEYIDDDQGYVVINPEMQLFKLLEIFINDFHVKFNTGVNSNNYRGISSIEIKGLPDESDIKELIEAKLNLSHFLPKIGRADRQFI